MVTVFTTLSERPPTEPTERPGYVNVGLYNELVAGEIGKKGLLYLPEQVPPVKVMDVLELMARQSSWFWLPICQLSIDINRHKTHMLAPEIITIRRLA